MIPFGLLHASGLALYLLAEFILFWRMFWCVL
jgi:hypothetical protein